MRVVCYKLPNPDMGSKSDPYPLAQIVRVVCYKLHVAIWGGYLVPGVQIRPRPSRTKRAGCLLQTPPHTLEGREGDIWGHINTPNPPKVGFWRGFGPHIGTSDPVQPLRDPNPPYPHSNLGHFGGSPGSGGKSPIGFCTALRLNHPIWGYPLLVVYPGPSAGRGT